MAWFALFLACAAPASEAPSPAMPELPPFEDAAIEPLYHEIAAWADGLGWSASPLRRGGPRLERSWTRGEPGKGERPAPGTARLALAVFASSQPKESYGLQWSAAITEPDGQGLRLLMVSGARAITPDQVRIDLQRGAEPAVELGAPLVWSLGERSLHSARPSGLAEVRAKLAAYRGEAFAATAELDLRALEAVVRPVLERGDYTVCDHGPSPGRGIPGPCLPRAPTEAERDAHRASFDAELARRREVLGDGAGWAALLDRVAPAI